MKRIISLTAFVVAAILVTVGCTHTGTIGKRVDEVVQGQRDDRSDVSQSLPGENKTEPTPTEGGSGGPEAKHSPEALFTDYQEAKTDLIRHITQAIYADPLVGLTSDPSLVNIFEVDAIMWAAFILWEDEAIVEQTGRFLGKQDFKVEKSKGQAKVSYTDDNRQKITLTANYDEASDHYVFVADHENGNKPYMEIVRTPYGLAGQSYTGGAGMIHNLYLISIQGENGIIGIVHDSDPPSPLTGKEAFDFPKSAGEWYHYDDGHLTGVNRAGEVIDSDNP